ncbi:Multi antimicrobial extrusion protein (Na(+)/drug antiporter), MATE family of MDR efflux pumps [Halanaerobium saccharolyticum subsp. saccharolyticum DSM 6643]|uniref:Multi antimicrobial extrusion protein (Na(+)/drug antiporter), MATE family of MDR efflux pumps n=1 Tax=Halanaerobium saccharolyticum subsp. saccharolyticum DSM 6643 TaxID=1293054 RepID=M5E4R7_9FIRM|nr:MATE family efflux transporter [Halanaerobium saccharolyticum]CCU80993.1 Multi antimicrobial extrusion protein (Na(+)/drug antiporter), MATE family of MDR efflux pumps [Halanaerobium saccharolyticum subsp. saccharolyticum DSM 6643]
MKKLKQKNNLNNREAILNDSIPKTLFKLSWPIMVGNTMQVLYNLADTFWVGKLGADSVAAISVGFPLVFLLISIGGGMTIAGTTLVAQYTGSDNKKMADHVAGQIFSLVIFLSLIFGAAGFIFDRTILGWIGAPANIMDEAVAYLDIIFAGVAFMFIFFVFTALLRGVGDTKTPMKMMVFSTLFNIILDPFLILGWGFFPQMGVRGAAIATVLARALAGLYGVYLLFKGEKGIKLYAKNLIPDFKVQKRIIKLGTPSAAEQSIIALGMTFLMGIVSEFGTLAVAAYGIGNRILSVVMMPMRGLSMATTTMVGQTMGADDPDRAEKIAWTAVGLTFSLMMSMILVTQFFPAQIISVFNDNPKVVAIGVDFLKIVGLSFGFLGVRIVIGGSFRGAGNTVAAMVLAVVALWGFRVPLARLLSNYFQLGTTGIWWGMFISNFLSAIIGGIWFKKGSWKEKKAI